MHCTEGRRGATGGMALAIAVFAIAAIGATVAGSLMPGVLEHQSGRNILYRTQAAAASEAELSWLLASLEPGTLLALPTAGASSDLGSASPGAGLSVERRVSRLGENLFLIRVRGLRIDAGGRTLAARGAGLLVRVGADSLSGKDALAPLPRGWLQLY